MVPPWYLGSVRVKPMSEVTLTLSRVRKLEPGEIAWDKDVPGFFARKNASGSISFILKTRVQGKQRKLSLGKLGVVTVEKARDLARDYAFSARKGIEPRPDAPANPSPLMKDAIAAFIETYGMRIKPRTKEEYERMLKLHVLPRFKKKTVKDITQADVRAMHEAMGKTPRNANNVLTALSKMMTWSIERGWRDKDSNPCKGVVRYRETRRNRYLSPDEAKRLGDTLRRVIGDGTENMYVVAAIWLIIFTGARRNEVLTLKWDYVDQERRMLVLPDSKTGPKSILLNRHALAVLAGLTKVKGNPYVFIGHVTGKSLINIAKPWERIRKLAKLPGLRLHDLRHSFGNRAIDAGGTTRVLGILLGHSDEDTTAIYAHVSDSRAVQLVDATGDLIAQSMKYTVRPGLRARLRQRPLPLKFKRKPVAA